MNFKIGLLFFGLFLSVIPSTFAQKLKNTKLPYNVTVGIPANFSEMPDDLFQKKYASYLSPIAKYYSIDGSADFVVNVNVNKLMQVVNDDLGVLSRDAPNTDLNILKDMYKSTIMRSHSNVQFIQEVVSPAGKKQFVVLEFVAEIKDLDADGDFQGKGKRVYYYLKYALKDGEVLIFNFNCDALMQNEWSETADLIMKSIKF